MCEVRTAEDALRSIVKYIHITVAFTYMADVYIL